jgi:hypothetical protein
MQRIDEQGNKKISKLSIPYKELPLIINFMSSTGENKEYILKTNSAQDKLLLNKKDY